MPDEAHRRKLTVKKVWNAGIPHFFVPLHFLKIIDYAAHDEHYIENFAKKVVRLTKRPATKGLQPVGGWQRLTEVDSGFFTDKREASYSFGVAKPDEYEAFIPC